MSILDRWSPSIVRLILGLKKYILMLLRMCSDYDLRLKIQILISPGILHNISAPIVYFSFHIIATSMQTRLWYTYLGTNWLLQHLKRHGWEIITKNCSIGTEKWISVIMTRHNNNKTKYSKRIKRFMEGLLVSGNQTLHVAVEAA